ncbi:hypothetical protein HYW44_04025 [Candidatus Daviesbacteria bacterium]|nr:hypothetical protein [Candidatus Daviesbacteria bacterium]
MKFLSLLPYIFVFIASLYQPWDTDLGWHLKYGEHFFKYGEILRTNIYSTEMPGFHWANTGWLSDIITYQIFNLGGFLGLTIAASVVITLTFWFFSKAYGLNLFEKVIIFPLLAILESPINEISFRGQLVSILLLGVLMYLLIKTGKKRQIILVPLLFVFWINLHGQFILGLAILFLFAGLRILENLLSFDGKINLSGINKAFLSNKFYIYLAILSVLATLINPFGVNIYKTAFSHFSNKDLQYIVEYLPFEDLSQPWWNQMIFGIFAFLGLVYLFFSDEFKKNLPSIGIVTILYTLSWWVRRYAWSMYYLGIPLLKPLANFIKPDSEKTAKIAAGILFIAYIGSAVYIKLPLSQFTLMNWDIYCAAYNNCSPKAVEFVRDSGLTDNLLSLYGWGGYMIWNYPEVKPSIDGRMHLWKDDKGYSAFSDYYALEQNWSDVDKSKYNAVLMWKDKPIYTRLEELVSEGRWKKEYEDDLAGVFTRINNNSNTFDF